MKTKKIITGIAAFLLTLSVTLTSLPTAVHAAAILDVPITPTATDCSLLGVYGSYFSQAQMALEDVYKRQLLLLFFYPYLHHRQTADSDEVR